MNAIKPIIVALVLLAPLWTRLSEAADTPAPQSAVGASQDTTAARAAEALVAPEKLTRAGLSPATYAFKQQVYRLHVERGLKSGRTRIHDLPASELAFVPGTDIKMQRDAAALGRLLAAARLDLAHDLTAPGDTPEIETRRVHAQRVQELGINNAYRSASQQFAIWDRNFQKYYAATAAKRGACVGGEHGPAAAELLRNYIGVRVAAPGFSNHQGGIAVDLALRLKPVPQQANDQQTLGASTAQSDAWEDSWFWHWLNRRAGEFGFIPYLPEAWHWEYKPALVGKTR